MTTQSYPSLGVLELPASFFARKPLVTADGHHLTADDRFDLMELVHRFEWSGGAANQEALDELFTDDIWIDHGMGQAHGKEEMKSLGVPTYGLRHLLTNHVIFIDDKGQANLVCHMTVFIAENPEAAAGDDLPRVLDTGVNRYVFHRESGIFKSREEKRWKIAEAHFTQQRLAAWIGVPEQVIAQMAETQSQRLARLGK